jgi:hypothetical protein
MVSVSFSWPFRLLWKRGAQTLIPILVILIVSGTNRRKQIVIGRGAQPRGGGVERMLPCVSEASEEHFSCFLRGMFINVMNFLHSKLQDFVIHFVTFYNFVLPVLKQTFALYAITSMNWFCSY